MRFEKLNSLKSNSYKELVSSIKIMIALIIPRGERFIFWVVFVLTEVHGLANHLARSQLVPCPKQCISVSGLSLGLQNNSLPSAHATRLILTPFPHSAEHCNNNECHATVFQKCIHTSSLSRSRERKLNLVTFEISSLLLYHKNHHTKVILFNY